jgi:hypothetical protein
MKQIKMNSIVLIFPRNVVCFSAGREIQCLVPSFSSERRKEFRRVITVFIAARHLTVSCASWTRAALPALPVISIDISVRRPYRTVHWLS